MISSRATPFTQDRSYEEKQPVGDTELVHENQQGRSSAVERIVHIDDVAGSNPAAPTKMRRESSLRAATLHVAPIAKSLRVTLTQTGLPVYHFIGNSDGPIRLPDSYGSDEFWEAYRLARDGVRCRRPVTATYRSSSNRTRVYFIKCGAFVKIGRGKNPQARLDDLQIGNPEPLKIVFTIPGSALVEKAFHARFAAYRTTGEWFRVTGDLAAFMRKRLRERMPADWQPE